MADRTMNFERQLLAPFREAYRQGRSDVAEYLLRALEALITALPFPSYRTASMFWPKPTMNSFVDSIEHALIDRQATAFVG
ncbi:hypothetical protein [Mesorhizobium sp. M0701]|uniref:hypothetical protein n=1 Tax=Mesorhizobium sp. M0701 TaxID=2956989 RepID=UPI00333B5D8E